MRHPSLFEFVARLDETARWCLAHASVAAPATSLRVSSLHPGIDVDGIASSVTPELVDRIASERQRQAQHLPVPEPGDRRGGRLLAYAPDYSLFDGAAAAESHLFLDDDNAPPPATWVCHVEETATPTQYKPFTNYLLAWIPQPFVALVDGGIAVNPEECILWANDPKLHSLPFIQHLRSAGLLV